MVIKSDVVTNWRAKVVYSPEVLRRLQEGVCRFWQPQNWKSETEVMKYLERLQKYEKTWKKKSSPAKYHGGKMDIHLGDRVELRSLFRKRSGIINYVPGISEPHGEMEHHGLYWVGISFPNGSFTAVVIDPDTGCLAKKIHFLERGTADATTPLPPEPWE